MKSYWLVIVWGYATEILLASAVLLVLGFSLGFNALSGFVQKGASEWAQLTTTFFATAVAAWLTFANLRATGFGDYLHSRGAVAVYSKAFLASIFVHLIATVAVISAKGCESVSIALISRRMIVYSLINIVTLLRNASGLIALYGVFRELQNKQSALTNEKSGA